MYSRARLVIAPQIYRKMTEFVSLCEIDMVRRALRLCSVCPAFTRVTHTPTPRGVVIRPASSAAASPLSVPLLLAGLAVPETVSLLYVALDLGLHRLTELPRLVYCHETLWEPHTVWQERCRWTAIQHMQRKSHSRLICSSKTVKKQKFSLVHCVLLVIQSHVYIYAIVAGLPIQEGQCV